MGARAEGPQDRRARPQHRNTIKIPIITITYTITHYIQVGPNMTEKEFWERYFRYEMARKVGRLIE